MPLLARHPFLSSVLASAVLSITFATPAAAFCGFYVGKADAKLFNEASQVILARDGDRTVISMRNDFQGELAEFALVVPVPVVLQKSQIHVGDPKIFGRIDAYSAPRLAEYFDPNPCEVRKAMRMAQMDAAMPASLAKEEKDRRDKALGVTVEATYTIGEYDIVILSATQSNGLEQWLRQNGYNIPPRASKALQPYIRQGLKFFVAKVNLAEQAKTGFSYLRPLQFAFESERFMLPVRLGMLNARGPQDLVIYALTRNGRVETTNYRTVKLPSDLEIPVYVKAEFPAFYRSLFAQQVKAERMHTVFTEYAWDMNWCDPCAAAPLSHDELKGLGVFWLDESAQGQQAGVFLTRLHVRYDRAHFPEDLVFQETADRTNFQGRYVLRHAFKGELTCAANGYREDLRKRHEQEARTLADLTGWSTSEIRQKMNLDAESADSRKWWEKIWGR